MAVDPIITASAITAVPASIAAFVSLRTQHKIRTNHGKNIGQHIEDNGDVLHELLRWADFHQESDNELRGVLGLDPATYPLFPPRVGSEEHEGGAS